MMVGTSTPRVSYLTVIMVLTVMLIMTSALPVRSSESLFYFSILLSSGFLYIIVRIENCNIFYQCGSVAPSC
jgi:hypothetical protein